MSKQLYKNVFKLQITCNLTVVTLSKTTLSPKLDILKVLDFETVQHLLRFPIAKIAANGLTVDFDQTEPNLLLVQLSICYRSIKTFKLYTVMK